MHSVNASAVMVVVMLLDFWVSVNSNGEKQLQPRRYFFQKSTHCPIAGLGL